MTRHAPTGRQCLVLCGGLHILQRQTPCSHSLPVSACFSRFAACSVVAELSVMTFAPYKLECLLVRCSNAWAP